MAMCRKQKYLFIFLLFNLIFVNRGAAEATDIRIIAERRGFPLAIPNLCDQGKGGTFGKEIADLTIRNLALTGLFSIVDASTVKSVCSNELFSGLEKWSETGAEAVVVGRTKAGGFEGQQLVVDLYLYDLKKRDAVLGKSYDVPEAEVNDVARQFSNEIIKYFTGQEGLFGSQIAFVGSRNEDKHDLYLIDLNGQKISQLTNGGGAVSSPAWAPKGEELIFTLTKDGTSDLYAVNPRKKTLRQVTALMGEERYPQYSPDGKTIMSTALVSGKSSIALFNLRGRLLKNLTPYTVADVSASWSPDGKQIAFCSDQEGKRQIYVMSAEGGAAKKISYAHLDQCYSPDWSPRGDWIAFVCMAPGGAKIFAANPTGTDVIQLTFGGDSATPSWSPDGNMLAYVTKVESGGEKSKLAIYSLLSGKSEILDIDLAGVSMPAWSPLR